MYSTFEILRSRQSQDSFLKKVSLLQRTNKLAWEASLRGAGCLICLIHVGPFSTQPYWSGSQGANVYVFSKENQIKMILSKIKSVGGNSWGALQGWNLKFNYKHKILRLLHNQTGQICCPIVWWGTWGNHFWKSYLLALFPYFVHLRISPQAIQCYFSGRTHYLMEKLHDGFNTRQRHLKIATKT